MTHASVFSGIGGPEVAATMLGWENLFHCEIDLFHLQKGEKRARYFELWAQGHTPTEIAEMTGSTCGNVGSSVTRSIQFLQKYFRHEKELLRT